MAIDYGAKRVGVAVTDPLQIIATALDTVDTPVLFTYLDTYFKKETVDKLVVGMPYNHGYAENAVMPKILLFIEQFKKKYPTIIVDTLDERFTSKMASSIILQSGVNKKARRDKATIDRVSAVVLLQSYMG